MREIKFRVWDIKEKKMSKPVGFKNIKAYDGEMQTIWLDDGQDGIEIGNDLGWGRNEAEAIQSNLIFLQFTGLHDKTKWEQLTPKEQEDWLKRGGTKETWHGKEILEGDIIRNNWTNIYGKFIGDVWVIKFGEYDDSDSEWGSPALGFYAENQGGEQQSPINLQTDSQERVEVIGNIYENPELLGGDNAKEQTA